MSSAGDKSAYLKKKQEKSEKRDLRGEKRKHDQSDKRPLFVTEAVQMGGLGNGIEFLTTTYVLVVILQG